MQMVWPLLLGVLLTADPTAEQVQVLKTFRNEFVELTPPKEELQPFAISKYEVTQELWQAVMGANPSKWKGPRNSVEMVSFTEAQTFCRDTTRLLVAAGLI